MSGFASTLRMAARLSWLETRVSLSSLRMIVLVPIMALFIVGSSWGFADPNADLPGGIRADTPYEVLFLTSLFILFSSTLGVVLVGFDSISRRRTSGVLAIEFCQPVNRLILGTSQLIGTWAAVCIPTFALSLLGIVLIERQMGAWPSAVELGIYFAATALVLLWYASIQLLASSLARDVGSAVTLGVGTWLLFTMVWLLVTVVAAALFGVDATNTSDAGFKAFAANVDLLSPNGVYQLLLEARLEGDLSRPIETWMLILSATAWTMLPSGAFLWRYSTLNP